MRKVLRILALCVLVGSIVLWALLGMNTGWTKNSVTRFELDPVTEIEGPVIEKRFIPGVELLAGAFAAAAILFGISFAFGRNKIVKAINENESNHS